MDDGIKRFKGKKLIKWENEMKKIRKETLEERK